MTDFLKKNTVTLLIVLATIILAGIAIFTAVRLYQLRQTSVAPNAPSSQPAAAQVGNKCGQTCNSNADCASPSANGGTVQCIQGTCQNIACPAGKTVPGANCDCSALNACGQPCNASVGLCQAGSVCRFVSGPSCTDNHVNTAFCFPTSSSSSSNPPKDNLPTGWTTNICAGNTPGNANYYVLNSSGANPAGFEVAQICSNLLASTPTPVPSTVPSTCNLNFTIALASISPTPTATATASPTPTPTPVAQCGTSCKTNSDCPSSMTCYVGVCRNPSCSASTSCVCATATASPTPTPTTIAFVPTTTPSPTPAPSLPTAGNTTPTILGLGAGTILLIIGLAIVL